MEKPSGRKTFQLSGGVEVTWSWGTVGLQELDWRGWDDFCNSQGVHSIFLEGRMMQTLMACPERCIAALEWRRAGTLLGIAGVEDTTAESVNLEEHISSERFWFHLINRIMHGRDGRFRFRVRVVGTVLGSGVHGQCWSRDVAAVDAQRWLEETVFESVGIDGGRAPGVVMLKDEPIDREGPRTVRIPGWIPLEFDPEMVFHLQPDWTNFDAYLAELKTKARTKINRILALSESFEIRPWSLPQLEQGADVLIALYRKVYERSGFRLGSLHAAELIASKRIWGDDFVVNVYYHDEKIMGFQCAYVGAEETEAFFVGFDPELIKTHAIYQRMLVEFICLGVSRRSKRVNMGRTALEIKSSVGALPRRLQCDVRFKNRLFHRLVHAYTRGYEPAALSLRQPWKSDAYPLTAHSEFHPVIASAPLVTSPVHA